MEQVLQGLKEPWVPPGQRVLSVLLGRPVFKVRLAVQAHPVLLVPLDQPVLSDQLAALVLLDFQEAPGQLVALDQ